MRRLTQEAKKTIVEKALNRKDQKLSEIASMHNIGFSTLENWIRQYKEGKLSTPNNTPSSTVHLSRSEQLEHLLATSSLDDAGLGAYCREHGLYSFQLKQWKNEFMSQDNNQKKQEAQSELKALRAENKLLKKICYAKIEALLVLKKRTYSLGLGDV